jgi:hypothetical protein
MGRYEMRRGVLRLLGIVIVGAAVGIALGGRADASGALARCYIDMVDYYADAACTEIVGAVARGCDWQVAWEWGAQGDYWIQYIDGGYEYCPLSGCGAEWHQTLYNCPARTPGSGQASTRPNSR